MPDKPKPGGYYWNGDVAHIRSAARKQRRIIERIAEGGMGQAEVLQSVLAISLLAAQIDERAESLEKFKQ